MDLGERVQGRVPGCPGVFTPPACPQRPRDGVRYIDLVLDRVKDIERVLGGWSQAAWQVLDETAESESPAREEVRGIARCCAQSCQRDAIVPFAVESVSALIPAEVGARGRLAVTDAVTGALLADVLPAISFAVLTRPLHVAAGPLDQ